MRAIHHAAVFTSDYAAWASFVRDVFAADAPERCDQPSVIRAGGVTLHVFEDSGVTAGWGPTHLHHLGLEADDLAEFERIRARLVARGAATGEVEDFGMHISVLATDPDGGMLEVMLPPGTDRATLPFEPRPHR